MPSRPPAFRIVRAQDVGRLIAEGRRRARLTQEAFASRVGISRKTLSDLERGASEHVSLKTVLKALALAGYVLEASVRRPPTLSEVMAERAEHQTRIDGLGMVTPPTPQPRIPTPRVGERPKRRG